MRTTLVVPDSVYLRAKQAAQRRGCTVSALFTEAVAVKLAREEGTARETVPVYKVASIPMGAAQVDVNSREALYRRMDE